MAFLKFLTFSSGHVGQRHAQKLRIEDGQKVSLGCAACWEELWVGRAAIWSLQLTTDTALRPWLLLRTWHQEQGIHTRLQHGGIVRGTEDEDGAMEDGGNFYSGITVPFRCLTSKNHLKILWNHE